MTEELQVQSEEFKRKRKNCTEELRTTNEQLESRTEEVERTADLSD